MRWTGAAMVIVAMIVMPARVGAQLLPAAPAVPAVPSCTLALTPGGAMQLAGDGRTLSTQNGSVGGASVVVSSGNMTPEVVLSAPTMFGPPGWSASPTTTLSVDTLSGTHTGYTGNRIAIRPSPTVDTLTINARIASNSGFKAGNYTVGTMLTCQAA